MGFRDIVRAFDVNVIMGMGSTLDARARVILAGVTHAVTLSHPGGFVGRA